MAENASVIAALGWRLTQQAIRRMRQAGFDIEAGPQYFEVVCEFLAFVLHAADRIVFGCVQRAQRTEFTTALAHALARILDENGEMLGGTAPAACGEHFIDVANRRADDYAHLRFDDNGPGFAFACYFGNQLRELLADKDRSWIVDHIIEVEAPEAVRAVSKALRDLLSEPREASREGSPPE
jgi:hypothetical protein